MNAEEARLPLVRDAQRGDAEAIARVHVRAWSRAYRGLIPDDVIEARAARRVEDWMEHLSSKSAREPVVLAELEGEVVGFGAGGPSPDPDLHSDSTASIAEVRALYVDPGRWRSGVGSALLAELLERLRRVGFASAALWVLEANVPARRFYEGRGWQADGRTRRDPERESLELRYRRQLV